ncbi:hypothetical protein O9G_003401 [Rozella allomycis CSF55]|uniref:Intraflagellar transport protein 122 homolog n=1 Tax=Rozella allomycis (strain CSF55) TaxID=988480 RepID=A0A075AZD3_ROZAC|nr:hypothetical protein O9G_003401 [Rozella allomycis CSF55]|eukprot:EPZ35509.1 hypothetical protein O9G_003401 [Rozella allomycis CSF55]
MKQSLLWQENVVDSNSCKVKIHSCAFNNDGSLILASANAQILVFDSLSGKLKETLKEHKKDVVSISFAKCKDLFASASADKSVVIWDALSFQTIARLTSSDQFRCVAWNPFHDMVAACSVSEIQFYSVGTRAAYRIKTSNKISACAWSSDGKYLAVGFLNGLIIYYDTEGNVHLEIEHSDCAIFSMVWNKNVLVVGDFKQTLTFYNVQGEKISKQRYLGFDVSSIAILNDYMIIGGSDRKSYLYSEEGVKLVTLVERDDWILSQSASQSILAVGSADGILSVHQLNQTTIHGLHDNIYAFRENMTNVIIHDLDNGLKAKIKCRDLVKRIAVFKDKLAILLNDRVALYELEDKDDMRYKLYKKTTLKMECSLMIVASENIVVCLDTKLILLTSQGEVAREWDFDSPIRYLKCIGGPSGRECLLTGLKNGSIFFVYIDNNFPRLVIKHDVGIRCLDVCQMKLAVVDDNFFCTIYDVKSKSVIEQIRNVESIAFNSDHEGLYCYSKDDVVYIKVGPFNPFVFKARGFVVGFKGSKVFCLNEIQMTSIDVPLSFAVDNYLSKKMIREAYTISCLGVTNGDWRKLGVESLHYLDFETALNCFVRLNDYRYIELIQKMKNTKAPLELILLEEDLLNGEFKSAAEKCKSLGMEERAMEILSTMGMFEEMNQLKLEINSKQILKEKAKFQQERNEMIEAADTLIEAGDYLQAIDILGSNGSVEKLIQLARRLSKMESEALRKCLYYFKLLNNWDYMSEILMKMGDILQLLQAYIDLQKWDEVFKIVDKDPSLAKIAYIPYINHLREKGDYEKAIRYYLKIDLIDEAVRLIGKLVEKYKVLKRYDLVSRKYLKIYSITKDVKYLNFSILYYAFYPVYNSVEEPFSTYSSEQLLNMARYLYSNWHVMDRKERAVFDISITHVLFCLFKESKKLGAFETARSAFTLLNEYLHPWTIQLDSLYLGIPSIKGDESLLPICYRCSAINPIINDEGPYCCNCGIKFFFSMFSFDHLPLVEIKLAENLSETEISKLISTASIQKSSTNILDNFDLNEKSPFITLQASSLEIIDAKSLVHVPETNSIYYNCVPDIPVVTCPNCHQLFSADDWEFGCLETSKCHFCGE